MEDNLEEEVVDKDIKRQSMTHHYPDDNPFSPFPRVSHSLTTAFGSDLRRREVELLS